MAGQRRIVLTGMTRGLGLAMARAFIARGHEVHGCGRNGRRLAELQQEFGSRHSFHTVDVADEKAVAAWAAAVLDHGAPDLLINNAAVMIPSMPLWQVPPAEFSRLMDINIKGVQNVIHHFVPAMVERQKGVIVNFSSGWGRSVDAGFAPYCASKWAIEGLTQALALELPPGMAAVPLSPGIVDTDMLRQAFCREAGNYQKPEKWAEKAVPFILNLSAGDNGKALSIGTD